MVGEKPITPGDRIPNFALPDHQGTKRSFYHELRGGPVLLVALRDPQDAATSQWLASLLSAIETWADRGAQLFVLSALPWPVPADRLELAGGRAFLDPRGQSLAPLLLRDDGRLAAGSLFLLDANQRVLTAAGLEGAPEEVQGALLADLDRWRTTQPAPSSISQGAPVLILPNVLDAAFRERLLGVWRDEHQEGGVSDGAANRYRAGAKRTLEHVVSNPELKRAINMTLARRISPELTKVFQFQAPFVFDVPIIMAYQPVRGDFFGLHRDDLREDRKRRFAMSLNLNDDYEGGELYFPEYAPHGYKMAAGTAAIFSVALLHEARPVTQGTRFVLTSFFCDPPAALAQGGSQAANTVQL